MPAAISMSVPPAVAVKTAENAPGTLAETDVNVVKNASVGMGDRDSSTSSPGVTGFGDFTASPFVSTPATKAEVVAPRSNGAVNPEERGAENANSGNGVVANSASATGLQYEGITVEQVSQIKAAVQKQQKFLGELLEHATAWEVAGAELKLYFPAAKKSFAEMLEGRDSLEKLRSISSNVLGRAMRVCAKLAASTSPQPATRAGSEQQELRAKFERDPMVRSILQRFGGKISEVRRAQEE
jgi:hypothetical protein